MTVAIFLVAMGIVTVVVPWVLARGPTLDESGAPAPAPDGGAFASLFTSDRERRLWLWTLVVLVAIYASLGPVRELALLLRERNLLRLSGGLALLVVGAAGAFRWVKQRPGRREVAVAVGVVAVYLVALIRIPIPEERTHLFEYGLVGVLVYQALWERRGNGRPVPLPAVIAVVVTGLLGWLDEGIQALLPNRVYDLRDVGFNALAGLLAITSSAILRRARRRDRGRGRVQATGPAPP